MTMNLPGTPIVELGSKDQFTIQMIFGASSGKANEKALVCLATCQDEEEKG